MTPAALEKDSTRRADAVDAHIGTRIREAREAAQMSQTALGEKLGVTYQMIQKYEDGRSRIAARVLMHIARELRKPLTFFEPPKG